MKAGTSGRSIIIAVGIRVSGNEGVNPAVGIEAWIAAVGWKTDVGTLMQLEKSGLKQLARRGEPAISQQASPFSIIANLNRPANARVLPRP